MGFAKKMEWFKWIRKYSTGILDSKTSSMETLIDSSSSKTINNYAYTSSVVADDEFINATSADVAAPQHQRPMLPPPTTSQDSPSPPQLPNDVYDCCVSLDGMPIKHEFQYTLTDVDRCGNIPKRDIEGLASKILESVYGTTMEFSPSRGQRTIKVTLNVCKQSTTANGCTTPSWSGQPHRSGRDRKHRSSKNDRLCGRPNAAATAETAAAYVATALEAAGCPLYGEVTEPPHYIKPRAKWYRREQLIEMVQKSLAENLSFQSLRKSILEKSEGHHRARTKRRGQSKNVVVGTMQAIPLPPVPVAKSKPHPKVAWSPYDFEPVAHIPSHHHHEQVKNIRSQRRSRGNGAIVVGGEHARAVKSSGRHQRHQQHKQQHHQHQQRRTAAVVVSGGIGDLQQSKDVLEQTKNDDHQRYKRAKLASKKIHHHIHEHHHYHHYDYYIV